MCSVMCFFIKAGIIHPGAIFAGLQFPLNMINSNYRTRYWIKCFIAVLALIVLFIFVPDRIFNIIKRNVINDLDGYILVSLLLITRLTVFLLRRKISKADFLALFLVVLTFLMFGEFGQRLLISLIFIFDYFLITRFYRSKQIVMSYCIILFFESFARYWIVGNFWGPHAFNLS